MSSEDYEPNPSADGAEPTAVEVEIDSQDLLERLDPEPPEDGWEIRIPPEAFEQMFDGKEAVYDHPQFDNVRFCLRAEVDVDLSEVFA